MCCGEKRAETRPPPEIRRRESWTRPVTRAAISLGAIALLSDCFFSYWCGGIGHHLNLDMRGHFAMQLDGHLEIAEALERLVQLDLAAIHFEALGCELGGDVRRGDGTKELALSPDLRVKLSTTG